VKSGRPQRGRVTGYAGSAKLTGKGCRMVWLPAREIIAMSDTKRASTLSHPAASPDPNGISRPLRRRDLFGALAAGGAGVVAATGAQGQNRDLSLDSIKKEAEVACVYHCDFGSDERYNAMLRNINNHLSVYDFDPFKAKVVIVAHSVGIKYHLTTLESTPWAKAPPISPELDKRMEALAAYGVEVLLCRITFKLQNIDPALAKTRPYIKFIPSGVATVAALQGKGFAYIKVG
jgi:hypothetical protein